MISRILTVFFFLFGGSSVVLGFNIGHTSIDSYQPVFVSDDQPETVYVEAPMAEPAIAVEYDDSMVYLVEPYPKPISVIPPPPYLDGPILDIPYFGGGSELDSYFYQFCESGSDLYSCTRYGEIVERLSPKIEQIATLIQSTFDEERQEELRWMIRSIIENKFYEVATEKSKFTISFVRVALQEGLYEEDVEDIDSWLGDAITNIGSKGGIIALNEGPGDLLQISNGVISSSQNSFAVEVDARFDSGRPATPEQGYEVLAYFGEVGAYFIDREDTRHASYDYTAKTWKFEPNDQYGYESSYRSFGRVPDSDTVSIYLLCQYCDGEAFHPDRGNSRIADVQKYDFKKLDDDMVFDIALEVSSHTAVAQGEDTQITVNYTLTSEGVEELAGIRTNIWAYPIMDRGWYGDEGDDGLNRAIISAVCAGSAIDASDFEAGNITLGSKEICTVTESITIEGTNESDIELSVGVEARMDQDRNNNNRNTIIQL